MVAEEGEASPTFDLLRGVVHAECIVVTSSGPKVIGKAFWPDDRRAGFDLSVFIGSPGGFAFVEANPQMHRAGLAIVPNRLFASSRQGDARFPWFEHDRKADDAHGALIYAPHLSRKDIKIVASGVATLARAL
jgi:hypothetical protein